MLEMHGHSENELEYWFQVAIQQQAQLVNDKKTVIFR